MINKQKLKFVLADGEKGDITLTEALSGSAGTVVLGNEGVHLWVPGDESDPEREIVLDFRNRPLSDKIQEVYAEGMRGHFMTARVALLAQNRPSRIAKIREIFDFVLVPDAKIKNTPADLRAGVLGYTKK